MRNVLKHVHDFFWSSKWNVYNEVKGLLGLVEDVGHGHGEDVGCSLHRGEHLLGCGDQVQELLGHFPGLLGRFGLD